MLEKYIEKAILNYLESMRIFAFKVKDQVGLMPDGTPRRPSKYMVRGVSDIILCHQGKVLFIEVKSKTGKQSDHQKVFENNVTLAGCSYYIVRSVDDTIKVIEKEFGDIRRAWYT